MEFSLKLQEGEATIIHPCGNKVRIDNVGTMRLLENAVECGGLDPDDRQCLMNWLFDAMGGHRPMKVYAA